MMPIFVSCPSCACRLSLGEHLLGKRVKCPKCASIFPAEAPAEDATAQERVTTVVPIEPAEGAVKVLPPPLPSAPERADYDLDAGPDDDVERPRKKKGKKKKPERSTRTVLSTHSSWPWWVFGGSGILAVELTLLLLAIFLDEPLFRSFAAYLFVMVPISTVIFFAAMWLSSVYFGALEIGELHVALVKAFILVTIVNVFSLFPCGFAFTLLLWWGGILTLYRLDPWEARILTAVNWVLNLGLKVLILLMLASLAGRGAG